MGERHLRVWSLLSSVGTAGAGRRLVLLAVLLLLSVFGNVMQLRGVGLELLAELAQVAGDPRKLVLEL